MIAKTIAIQALSVTVMLSAAGQGYAQALKATYSRIAPTSGDRHGSQRSPGGRIS
jgi:hypothetical protein